MKLACLLGAILCALTVGSPADAGARPYACQGVNLFAGEPPLCSKTFYAEGECQEGTEVLATLKDTGGRPNARFVKPWEPFPIIIRSVAINFIGGPAPIYALAGNSYAQDIMGELGRGQYFVRTPTTERFGFPFPAADDANEHHHLDLHVGCPSAMTFSAYYTIYYTPLRPPAEPAPTQTTK